MVIHIVKSFSGLGRQKNHVLLCENTAVRMYNERGQWTSSSDAIGETEDVVVDVECRPRVAALLATHFSTGDSGFDRLDYLGWDDMLESLVCWAKNGSVVITLYDVDIDKVRDFLVRTCHATIA